MRAPKFDGAAEFARLAEEANEEREQLKEVEFDELKSENTLFWFAVTLLIGLVLRLFGIVDVNESNDENRDIPTLTVTEITTCLRSIGISMYALAKGANPYKALQCVLLNEDGGVSPLFAYTEVMIDSFERHGAQDLDGLEIRSFLRDIIAKRGGDSCDAEFRSHVRQDIGVPTPGSGVEEPSDEDELLFGKVFEEANNLSTPELVFQLQQRVSACECMVSEYQGEKFPFDVLPPSLGGEPDHEKELNAAAVVFAEFIRKFNVHGTCSTCSKVIKHHSCDTEQSQEVLRRSIPPLKMSGILSSFEGFIGELLTSEGIGINPSRIGRFGGLGFSNRVLSGLVVTPDDGLWDGDPLESWELPSDSRCSSDFHPESVIVSRSCSLSASESQALPLYGCA